MTVVDLPVKKEVAVEQPGKCRPENGDITSSSNDEDNEMDSKPSNGEHKNHEEKEKNEISENIVYFDKNKGKIPEDVDVPKLVNAVMNNQRIANVKDNIESASNASTSSPTLTEENNVATRGGARKNVRIDIEEESDDEVIELEFERAVEHTHMYTPYCPNCKSQITKVILRRKKHPPPIADEPVDLLRREEHPPPIADEPVDLLRRKEHPPPIADEPVDLLRREEHPPPISDEPADLFRCSSCFSIFTLSENCLKYFPIFGSSKKPENALLVAEEQGSGTGGSTAAVGSANVNQGGCFDLFGMFPKKRGNQKARNSESTTQNDEESQTGGSQKPDDTDTNRQHDPSLPRENVAIDIGHGVDESGTGQQPEISAEHRSKSLEILKCIIHGGLIELIASLSVVSSAAASDATTLNIIALGVASVISGLFVFSKNVKLLGRRGHFLLHATFAILSFLVFGIIPPIVYGFTFRESDNKDYKILAVAAASFACLFILAIGKAYTRRRSQKFRDYVKTILYYIIMAISVSGVAYAAGDLIKMLMDRLGWLVPNQTAPSFVPDMISATPWASY
ncbi:hypothetical protein CDL12_01066 [Handroanthus impetiginosus]|uniref:Membrane protein of ER body-like protein n=1 Tax=Handroanthus impetiginosus TaxID=429701 RepID=A0A2G9I8V6_9LAMI|nr:hypothetical protein CDL12_01066 [Handroanthus impetiginosus]